MTKTTTKTTNDPRKSIVIALDRAAARSDLVNKDPATGKQCWYLAGLLAAQGKDAANLGCEITNQNCILTKRQASMYIEQLLGGR